MAIYQPPLRDHRFVLSELLDWSRVRELPGMADLTMDVVEAVLEQAGKICTDVLLPLNRPGDEEGCLFENGKVRTPAGFKEAYALFREHGWTSLGCAPEDGGQGLPETLVFCLEEMTASANMSFGNYANLSRGAYKVVRECGTETQKRIYLPRLADGTWSGTMCLTEPHCGTDLGLMRTKAEPHGQGGYAITGAKIFITSGEHDLTDNIVHLVLARLPDAPPGIKGVSLFLVPKLLVDDTGRLGPRNGVRCDSIEHKMGIRGSATCAINFEGAQGTLLGAPHRGMRSMFVMMNFMRMVIGIQGLGLAEVAYQTAREYSRNRLQSRSISGAKYPEKPADPIIVHPDVRRVLLTIKAYAEGSRALALWVGMQADIANKHPDPACREEAEDLRALLTPVVKAFVSDIGFESTSLGMSVLGGHGYIREWGMEQLVRDAKITQLYEGTNGIQALDLVARKLPMNDGRLVKRFLAHIERFIEEHRADAAMREFLHPLNRALHALEQATTHLTDRAIANADDLGAGAVDYLRLMALVSLGFLWARAAQVALAKQADDPRFYRAKLATARFFMSKLLPQTASLLAVIHAGAEPLMQLTEDEF